MKWTVTFSGKAAKQFRKLPLPVQCQIQALAGEMKILGPHCYQWKSFGKLGGSANKYHCHVHLGRPTYVVCWELTDKKAGMIEIYYVGTHENAPY